MPNTYGMSEWDVEEKMNSHYQYDDNDVFDMDSDDDVIYETPRFGTLHFGY